MEIGTIIRTVALLGKERTQDLIIDLGLEAGKNQLMKNKKEREIRESLQIFIDNKASYNELCSLSEEIDFEGLIEYLKANAIDDIRKRLGSSSSKERATARESILNRAIFYAKASTNDSKNRVRAIVDKITNILRNYYVKELGYGDLMLAAIIEDDLSETIINVANTVGSEIVKSNSTIIGHVNSSTEKLDSKIFQIEQTLADLGNKLVDTDTADVKNGMIELAENKLTSHLNELGSHHALFPDYRYKIVNDKSRIRLVSIPNNEAALKKYPPTIKVHGKAFIDGKKVPLSADTLGYAQRHQKRIEFTIDKAEMYLGTIKDPSQYFAEQIIGRHIILPKPFSVIPSKITVDGQVLREYIELKTDEILEDGTRIMSNLAESDSFIRYKISVSENDSKGHCKVYFDGKNNAERYKYYKECYSIGACRNIEIESFKEPKLYIKFNKKPVVLDEYQEYTLRLFKWITTIENYYGIQFPLFDKLTEEETGLIEYVYYLIVGCSTADSWEKVDIPITKTANPIFLENTEYDIEYNESDYVQLLGVPMTIHKHITVLRAQIQNFEKVVRKLDVIEQGDCIKITFIPGNNIGTYVEKICSSKDDFDSINLSSCE